MGFSWAVSEAISRPACPVETPAILYRFDPRDQKGARTYQVSSQEAQRLLPGIPGQQLFTANNILFGANHATRFPKIAAPRAKRGRDQPPKRSVLNNPVGRL
jgi:hypothetical protein